MKLPVVIVLAAVAIALLCCPALGQVLGPCGQTGGSETAAAANAGQGAPPAGPVQASAVPLPGERAIDFELTAVVGDEIKRIKLSDYQGMYRVLCFYPADFTFV